MKDNKRYVKKAPMLLQYFIPPQNVLFYIDNIEDLIATVNGSFPNTN